jgi:hypothetical protein
VRQFKALDDVIVHEEDGDAFLLHVASGRYYGLNRSGLVVWNAILNGTDPGTALTERWPQRPAEVLRGDAEKLVAQLLEAGLIAEESSSASP